MWERGFWVLVVFPCLCVRLVTFGGAHKWSACPESLTAGVMWSILDREQQLYKLIKPGDVFDRRPTKLKRVFLFKNGAAALKESRPLLRPLLREWLYYCA